MNKKVNSSQNLLLSSNKLLSGVETWFGYSKQMLMRQWTEDLCIAWIIYNKTYDRKTQKIKVSTCICSNQIKQFVTTYLEHIERLHKCVSFIVILRFSFWCNLKSYKRIHSENGWYMWKNVKFRVLFKQNILLPFRLRIK